MAPDPVLRGKVATIERCLVRVRELAGEDPCALDDQTIEDAVVLDLQRACESSIDAAMRVVSQRRLGLPQDSREAFTLLERATLLDAQVADRMRKMVGFRNVAIHADQDLDRAVLRRIVAERLVDVETFSRAVMGITSPEETPREEE